MMNDASGSAHPGEGRSAADGGAFSQEGETAGNKTPEPHNLFQHDDSKESGAGVTGTPPRADEHAASTSGDEPPPAAHEPAQNAGRESAVTASEQKEGAGSGGNLTEGAAEQGAAQTEDHSLLGADAASPPEPTEGLRMPEVYIPQRIDVFRTYLVFGGTGFIGSRMIETLLLNQMYRRVHWNSLPARLEERVVNIDKQSSESSPYQRLELVKMRCPGDYREINNVDLTDLQSVWEIVEETHPTHVIYLAAQANQGAALLDRGQTLIDGLGSIGSLLWALANQIQEQRRTWHMRDRIPQTFEDTPFNQAILTSTCEVLGETPEGVRGFDENAPYNFRAWYNAIKAVQEDLWQDYAEMYPGHFKLTRSCNVFGGDAQIQQRWENLVPRSMLSALYGINMQVTGDGSQKREWIYPDDLIERIFQVFTRSDHYLYHISTGDERTVQSVAEQSIQMIRTVSQNRYGTQTTIELGPRRPLDDNAYRLLSVNGDLVRPGIPFEEALRLTAAGYIEQYESGLLPVTKETLEQGRGARWDTTTIPEEELTAIARDVNLLRLYLDQEASDGWEDIILHALSKSLNISLL